MENVTVARTRTEPADVAQESVPRSPGRQSVRLEPARGRFSTGLLSNCVAMRFGVSAAIGVLSVALAATAMAAPRTPRIEWSPCYKDVGPNFQCGTVQVPLDHNGPDEAAISIALVRVPATDPGLRIGSAFFNPGGPGGSGVDFVLGLSPYLYTPEFRARFDIVGFDPRGIGRSTTLRCFGNLKQAVQTFAPFPFPDTPDEEAIQDQYNAVLAEACEQRGTHIIDHMSTAQVARDLDMLRQAVGDEKLTYVGLSYGSYIGSVYANMFPNSFRALVIDGVLDPIAWSTGAYGEESLPFSTRLRSDVGARAELDEFFRLCDEGAALPTPTCPFGPDSEARYEQLADQLRATPQLVIRPNGATAYFTYAVLVANTLGAMYDPYSWPSLARLLAALDAQVPASALGATLEALWQDMGFVTKRGVPRYPNWAEGFPGVACSDGDNPDTNQAWIDAGLAAESAHGYFGKLWTWASSQCALWPGFDEDRYLGPWNTTTPQSVLVIGNRFDPATNYQGAQTVRGLLPNSSLQTLNGWGHISLLYSAELDAAVASYLITGVPPADGAVYEPDWVPFDGSLPAAATNSAGFALRQFRARTMPDVVVSGVK